MPSPILGMITSVIFAKRLPAWGSTLAFVDPVKIKKDTVEIDGGRHLYNYTFEIEDETDGGLDENDSEEDTAK